jgi:hypothetical protein
MQLPDIINGAFEFTAALMVLNHCRVLLHDKAVAGVSILSTAFFTLWGGWNCFYYPHLGQWFSFAGGIAILVCNVVWVGLMIFFRQLAHATK